MENKDIPLQEYNDQSKREKLLKGEPLNFPKDLSPEQRIIPVELLKEAINKGVKIDVQNAIIKGPGDFKYQVFEKEVSIKDSEILNAIDFSYATFKQNLVFDGSTFNEDVDFRNAKMEFRMSIIGTVFKGDANFLDITIIGIFLGNKAHFSKKTTFGRANVAKSAFFKKATFEGEANFVSFKTGASAEFQ